MSNVLEMTKLPYLLTALLAAFSWNAVHLTNRYIDSPIIEWSYRVEKRGGEKVGIYDIYNLSRGKRFEDITFSLHLRRGYFTQCVVEKIVPAGNVAVSYPKAEAFQTQKIEKLEVTVTELHPKWKIRIIVGNSGNERPKLNFRCDDPVNLVARNFASFLVRNEISLLWGSMGLWVFLIGVYFVRLSGKHPV
jgi:hypothetical protein